MKGATFATVLMTATATLGFIQSLTPVRNTALSLLLLEHGVTVAYALPQGPWSDRGHLAARKALLADVTESPTPQPGPWHGPPGGMNGTGPGKPHHCHGPPHGNTTYPSHHQPQHGPHGAGNGTAPMGPPHHKCHKPPRPPMPMPPHHGGPPEDAVDTSATNNDWDDCWCDPEPAGPPSGGNSTATYSVPGATATMPDPSVTADPTATVDPSATIDPDTTADPSATADPSVSDDPTASITGGPNITAGPSATATV